MSLTPQALRILDSIGAYSRIKPRGFTFQAMTFMTDPGHEVTGKLYFGHKDVYGYDGLRITRKVIINELVKMVEEAGMEIHYRKKFTKIIKEDANGVEFEFEDGTREKAELLIGADGIHSKVRSHLFPEIQPQYTGFLGLTYCFPRANWQHLEDTFPLPCSIQGENGSFIITPQTEGGKEIFVGRQYKYDQKDRAGWKSLLENKEELIKMLQRDPNAWGPLMRAAQEQISSPDAHYLNVWPFYTVSEMDHWNSPHGKVVIIGDAAHAIPPSAGQGANQALEDSYSLGMLLGNLNGKTNLLEAFKAWGEYRIRRMVEVLRLTTRLMTLRMTEEERANMPEDMRWELDWKHDAGKAQLGWLYSVDIDRDVHGILEGLDSRNR